MIDVRDLEVSYDQPVLQGISLHIWEGEYVLLTGPSGSGKSTLALALGGIIPQIIPATVRGHIAVGGLDVTVHGVAELARQVGLVHQNPATQLFNEIVEEEVAFGPRSLGLPEPEIAARVAEALRATGIEHLVGRTVHQLSGGEQQRVTIAAVLAMSPRILVLDEPLANLDRQGGREVLSALERLHRLGVTILLIEHRLDAVASQVQRAILMDEGRIVADGPAAEILAQRELLDRLGLRHPRPTTDLPCEACGSPASGEPAAVPLVELEGIVAGYGKREALSGVDLTLFEGEFVALVGENGAGKTTLARLLAGILRPRRGRIRWASHLRHLPQGERMGLLFQNPVHQLVCDRVLDEVAYGLDNLRRPREPHLEALLAAADLSSLRERRPQSLSAGQQQRTALAAAMALSPRLLILDEPTLGQDWGHLSRMMDFLWKLNGQGQAILVITHDEKLVHRYARRIVTLEKGHIVADRYSSGEVKIHEQVVAA